MPLQLITSVAQFAFDIATVINLIVFFQWMDMQYTRLSPGIPIDHYNVCEACGSVVIDTELHDRFHDPFGILIREPIEGSGE